MFIAVRIDTNTAETFRHGVWYAKGDVKQRLDIVPFTLEQFREYFVAMFETKQATPEKLKDLILACEITRDVVDAPEWKRHIDHSVAVLSQEIRDGRSKKKKDAAPIIPTGAIVRHVAFGEGRVVALVASFPGCQTKTFEVPYLKELPDEITMAADGKTLRHERFGEGTVIAFVVVFKNHIMPMTYPASFADGSLTIE